jgi:predicted permease
MRVIRRILLKLSRRRRLEQEMEAELAFHRSLARENGNPVGLGNITRIQEEARDLWRFTLVEDFWRDVVYALRSLRRAPGFTVIAVLTLALGIGANTAIFTMLHRVMLAYLPVEKPEQIIEVLGTRGNGPPGVAFSYAALQDLRRGTQSCSSVLGFSSVTFHALIEGSPMERLPAEFVTGDYFSELGVKALVGRTLMPVDDRVGDGTTVAMISHKLWRERFGGTQDTIGKTIVLENVPYTIVGVAQPGFGGVEVGKQTDVWVPLESERLIRRPSRTASTASKWVQIIGRLKPQSTIEQAAAELRILYSHSIVENDIPEMLSGPRVDPAAVERMKSWSLIVEPAGRGLNRTRQQYDKPLRVLMAIVGVLLLIACTNVAHLLLARGRVREKELAVRLSIGAGRSRLIRQLFTESLLLVTVGSVLAVFVAYLLTLYLTGFLANSLVLSIAPNPATLGFTAAVAIVAAILFGSLPALRGTDFDFATRLKGGTPGSAHTRNYQWSSGLIVAQVALLLVLILCGGLFLRTLHNLNSIDLGFDRSNLLLAVVDPFGTTHSTETMMALTSQLVERVGSFPGVKSVSMTRFAPISGGSGTNLDFRVHRDGAATVLARGVWVNSVGPRYFATLGVPIISGREFNDRDSASSTPVVILNQTFAERYFGNVSPIGKIIHLRDAPMEIVGLVRDSKYSEIRETVEPAVYRPIYQQFGVPVQLLIRTERSPETIAAAVRAEAQSVIGRTVSVRERTLEDHINATIVQERLVARLAALFGGLALVLAVIGLYGVVSNSVSRRTKEIGIRIALGFDRRRAVSLVMHEVFLLVGAGIIVGLPLAMLVTGFLEKLLYGLTPDDPLNIVTAVGALLLSTFAAAFIPALRASRVDPIVALRNE